MTEVNENPHITNPIEGVTCICAPNPGPLTGPGTNTYVIGQRSVWIVDPGPQITRHLATIQRTVAGRPVKGIIVTHAHRDHSESAPHLAHILGVKTFGYAPDLPPTQDLGGGEGRDLDFAPDVEILDREVLETDLGDMTALWTPGHFPTHLCLALPGAILSADLVMGWATTVISPPDGDLRDFFASCEKLLTFPQRLYLPGHGQPVANGPSRIQELIAHRKTRTTQIISALSNAPQTPAELVEQIYTDTPKHLWPAATRNVLAHLLALTADGIVSADDPAERNSKYHIIN